MLAKSQASKMLFIAVTVLLIGALACAVDFGNGAEEDQDANIQETLAILQMTQAALGNQESVQPTDPPVIVEEPQPEEPLIEEVTEEPPDIVYEGIRFSFDQNITQNIIPATIQGQNLGPETMPSETYPTHIEFTLVDYAIGEHFHIPKIIIYPVDEFRAMSPYAGEIIDALKQTLISQPGGGSPSDLPFLPMWNAAQIFSAKVDYFNFKNGSGVRFLTMYGQDLWPVNNQSLFYTYQGITNDNQYYICAVLPITHPALPAEGEIDDPSSFYDNWDTYIADTLALLEAQDSFFPSLDNLDAMLASFEINR